jgi:integrase
MLRGLHALACQHPLFKGDDFSWFKRKILQLPHEAKAARRQRQINKMIPVELLTRLPELIRAERMHSSGLSPVQVARKVRDEVFAGLPLYWRQIQLRTLDLEANLKTQILPRDVRRKIYLPKSVEAELKCDPKTEVTYAHYKETATKNKQERFEALPPLAILREYIEVHRPLLVGSKDHSILVVNDAGEPMCKQDVISKLTTLSVRHLGVRVLPHARRRVAASYALGCGETIDTVRKMLGQSDAASTWLYADAASSSNGVVALEKLYSSEEKAL